MYRSLRRISLRGITASASKSRTSPPILASTREGSKSVMRLMPLRPAFMHSQVVRTSLPSGVTAPMPVTTTRRSPALAIGQSTANRLIAGDDERERGLDRRLPVDGRNRARLPEEAAQLLDGDLDAQRVTRQHGAAEAALVDSREERELAAVLGEREDRHRPGLCHGLDHEHAGHDGTPGKVPGELWLVGGHRLDRH